MSGTVKLTARINRLEAARAAAVLALAAERESHAMTRENLKDCAKSLRACRDVLAEVCTELLSHKAEEAEAAGSERVPCFLSNEWIRRAWGLLNG